jgi:branched-chain amino acid transport system permease protein
MLYDRLPRLIKPPWHPGAKVATASRAAARHRLETQVERRITPELIAEHRAHPFGPHSTDLQIVLRFLRRDLITTRPRYVIVAERPYESGYRIGENPRRPGAPIVLTGETFATEEEAEHAVFLRRLRDLDELA